MYNNVEESSHRADILMPEKFILDGVDLNLYEMNCDMPCMTWPTMKTSVEISAETHSTLSSAAQTCSVKRDSDVVDHDNKNHYRNV